MSEHESAAFRRQVEQWFEEHAPKKGGEGDFSGAHIVSGTSVEQFQHNERLAFDVTRRWQATLFEAGLAGRSWPSEYGGQSAPAWQDEVIAETQSRYGVSTKMAAVALEMLPAVLFAHGTHEQRLTHLPAVVRGDEGWCQLLSEPDAGSDLGSVRTVAAAVPGGWSVRGQKVWTSGAGCASFALLLARTEPDVAGTAGLSCLILDMSDPGVCVQPLRQMSGGYHFNEVFLDEVFVPATALIGELGGGRAVLRTMLSSERAAIGAGTSARSARQLVDLATRLARQDEPLARQAVVQAVAREHVLDLTVARLGAGAPIPSGGPVTKLLYSEHARLTAEAALGLLGTAAAVLGGPDAGPWQDRFLFAPGLRLGAARTRSSARPSPSGDSGCPASRRPRRIQLVVDLPTRERTARRGAPKGADRSGPRTRKGEQTRAQLVVAAKSVFERDGFLGARIVDIAQTAHVATGSFYHYFDSKEQIFREVAQLQEQRLTAPEDEGSEPADQGGGRSAWARIRQANRRYLARYRDEAALMGVIEQVSRYDTEVNEARIATMKHFVERAGRSIRQLQAEGRADPRLNASMAADALGAMVARFAEQWLVQGYRAYDFDQAVEQLTRLWGNALGLVPEGSGAPHP